MLSQLPPFIQTLLSLFALLAFARICGLAAVKVGQPSILGELMAGIFLGPTLLEKFAPEAVLFFRGGPEPKTFDIIIQISLLVFLFGAGADVALRNVSKHFRVSVAVSLCGWILPFGLGLSIFVFVREWAFALLAGSAVQGDFWKLSLFFATALSISAVPVIAKTLMDLGLYRSRMGVVTMTAAVMTDILAWIVFGFVGGGLGHGVFSLIAFVVGVALSFTSWIPERWLSRLAEFSRLWLAPLFFASVGLKVDFVANFDIAAVVLIFVVACIGKILGCGFAAKATGLESHEAWAVGSAMNARGAMEVILGIAALDALLISPVFFVALVIMAFGTSMMSGPLIRYFLERKIST